MFNRIIKLFKSKENFIWPFLKKILSMPVEFLVSAYVIRSFGPESIGVLNYALSFVFLFSILSNLGIDSILTTNLVSNHKNKGKIIGTALWVRLFGGLLMTISVVAISLIKEQSNLVSAVCIILSVSYLFEPFRAYETYFQSVLKNKILFKVEILVLLLSATMKILVVWNGLSIIYIAYTYLLSNLLRAIFYLMMYKKMHTIFGEWRYSNDYAVLLLKQGWPLCISTFASMLFLRIDQVLLGTLSNNYQVGIYAVAVKMLELWYFIPIALYSASFPLIVDAYNKSKEKFEIRMRLFSFTVFWLAVTIIIVTLLFGESMIELLFGNKYYESVQVLKILICSLVVTYLGYTMHQYLVVFNQMKFGLLNNVVNCIINILLNLLLIPKYGANGAAVASLVSYGFSLFMLASVKSLRPMYAIMLGVFSFKENIHAIRNKLY